MRWGWWWRWFIRWYVLGAEDLVILVRVRVVECPDDLVVWRDLKEDSFPTSADEGVAVDHPLGATKVVAIEVGRQHVLPGEIRRAVGSTRWKRVLARVVVDIGGELIDA